MASLILWKISPRGGGNRLSEMIRYATGVDLITAAVCASVGDTIGEIKRKNLPRILGRNCTSC